MDESCEGFDESRPFTRAQFRRAGGDSYRLRTKDYRQLTHGIWVSSAGVDDESMMRAALLIHPKGACVSHLSAAAVHGLPVPDRPFVHITVVAAKDRRFRPTIKPHVREAGVKIVLVRGMPVSDLISTFIECAGLLGFVDLVILGDALVRKFGITAAELLAACRRSSAYYAGLATFGAEFVRDGVDSPMETRLRLLIVLAGLPEPEVNVIIHNLDGTIRRRFDLCYRRIRLVIEYDGKHHVEIIEQWDKDIERREEIDADGYTMITINARAIFRHPERTLSRIRRQLVLLGWGNVPQIDEGWRDHFAS